jgi:hypothetical protein
MTDTRQPVNFDRATVALLRETVEYAWACLPPERRATTSTTLSAERILKSPAEGEHAPERLVNAAVRFFGARLQS